MKATKVIKNELKLIEKDLFIISMKVLKQIVDLNEMINLFVIELTPYQKRTPVTADNIMNYFIVNKDGINHIWNEIMINYPNVAPASRPCGREERNYIEDILDQIEIEIVFKEELETINKYAT